MIRITVEKIPYGDESKKVHMGTMDIANDGTGTLTSGNYRCRISKWGRPKEEWKSGRFQEFPRQRLGIWDLIFCALFSCGIGDRITKHCKGTIKKKETV